MADRGGLCSASGLKISIRERHTARERRCGSIVVPIGRSGVLNRVIYANLACTSPARHRICASIFAHLGENELIRRFLRRQAIFQIDTVVLHSGLCGTVPGHQGRATPKFSLGTQLDSGPPIPANWAIKSRHDATATSNHPIYQ